MLNIRKVCRELTDAFDSDEYDAVAIMTLIEILVDRVNIKSVPLTHKRLFLLTLIDLLDSHKEILAQISWDLPVQMMKFLNKYNIDITITLRESPVASAVILGFNLIALGGLPKETLNTACELLASLSYDDEVRNYEMDDTDDNSASPIDDEYEIDTEDENTENTASIEHNKPLLSYTRVPGDFFIGLKVYLLFELISASLKRISTLYPSRYLSIIVSSVEKMVLHTAEQIQDPNLLLRRIHSFCQSYIPIEVPKDILEKLGTGQDDALTQEELEEIVNKESEIQVKLFRRLCTNSIAGCCKTVAMAAEAKYFLKMGKQEYELPEFYENLFELQSRFYNFALSLDVDIKGELKNCLKESKRIYQALPADSEINSDDAEQRITEVVFRLSYSYKLQKMAYEKQLNMAAEGIVVLSAIYYLETDEHLYPEILLEDAIYLYLNFTTRSFYSSLYDNQNVESSSRYWLWVSLTHISCAEAKNQLSRINKYILKVFLKTLLLKCCKETGRNIRMSTLTLIARFLCLVKEELAFEFILETLENFPYPHGKSAMLVILNDLIKKTKSLDKCESTTDNRKDITDELSDKLKELNLKETPFIGLNKERMTDIHDLALEAIRIASKPDRKQTDINLVINYSDFFKSVESKWDKTLLKFFGKELALITKMAEQQETQEVDNNLEKK